MVRFAFVVAASLGCSSNPQPHRAAPPAPMPAQRVAASPAPVRAADTTEDERSDDAAAEAIDDAMAMEGTLEEQRVEGDGIKVDVSWWTMTGSTHVADALTITTPRGKLAFASADPDDLETEGGETVPLIEEIHNAGRDRWLLLGWSSYGEGMQTEHAWLVDGSAAPRIVDKLEWTTDRRHAGLALDPGTKLRIGIPVPKRTATRDDESALHAEDDWRLAHGKQTWSLQQLWKLRASEAHLLTVQAYTPPFKASASEQGWSGRFVWFSVEKRFVRR